MMKWADAVIAAQGNPLKTARVIALGWIAVDKMGDVAICSSLTINQFDAYGFACQLDLYNVPRPPNLAEVSGYSKPKRFYFADKVGEKT